MSEAGRIRVVIVDDEELARDRLKQLLEPVDDVTVVGEACDGEEALDLVTRLSPDLLLLDIQMPGCTGMEVAASLPDSGPRVIFCTAFDQHAVDAFEVQALDYLLKPVSRARLRAALDKVRAEQNETLPRIRPAGQYPERFLGRRGNRFWVIPCDEVHYFASEGGQTRLCTGSRQYWMQPSLSELEKTVDPDQFFRISREHLVHLTAVSQVVPTIGGFGQVVLRDSVRLDVSRRRFKPLLQRLEQR